MSFPDWLIGEDLQTGKLLKVLPQYRWQAQKDDSYVYALYPNTRHIPRNTRRVIDFFTERYGEIPYWTVAE